jgi:hypothetical protein
MARKDTTKCWGGFNAMQEIAIIEGSKLTAILAILLFLALTCFNLYQGRELINIDDVLKQREQSALSGTVWLWFTLPHVIYVSITHGPLDMDFRSMTSLQYVFTVLYSTGGLAAAVCLCFVDRDVRETLSLTNGKTAARDAPPAAIAYHSVRTV